MTTLETQKQIAKFLGTQRFAITEQSNNIFKSHEILLSTKITSLICAVRHFISVEYENLSFY